MIKEGLELVSSENRFLKNRLEKVETELSQWKERCMAKEYSLSKTTEPSQEPMEVVEIDSGENTKQVETLLQHKQSGFIRVSPQSSPSKKKSFQKCDWCDYQSESKSNLEKHFDATHKIRTIESSQNSVDEDNEKHPKTIHDVPDEHKKPLSDTRHKQRGRQYNCHQCSFQGTNSKNLKRHVRESQHTQFDSLKETCYTCNQVCMDFEDLMVHRKTVHASIINECRYFKEGRCKHSSSECWYRHGSYAEVVSNSNQSIPANSNQSLSPNPNFQSANTAFPPDKLDTVVMLLKELVMASQQSKENNLRKRPQGC